MIKKDLQKWLKENKIEGKLEHPSIEKFGDFSVRGDFDLKENSELIEKVEKVAGFTNIFIKKEKLIEEVKIIGEENWKKEIESIGKGKTMVIDYSAPNIAKPFGIGHLRSTNIGQAIYNIYQILGWKCIGDNHLGDWGTQFGKLMVAMKNLEWNNKDPKELTIDDMEKLYIKFHEEAEKKPELEDEAREWFKKLEEGDKTARQLWQYCIDASWKEFNRVYGILGVNIDYAYGESFYEDKMEVVIDDLRNKNIVTKSEGAEIVEFENPPAGRAGMPPAMVTKTNNTTTYFTRDLATIKYRVETWNPDLIIYEVGSDQILHFRQVFETAKRLGYDRNFVHVPHGMIRWADGKFSTRKGHTIHLEEVIEKAMEEAKKIAPDNDENKIKAVAIGAIKFNDLAQDPKRDIIFDWDKVMSMDGNSGPYLQYTYARCQSILSKTNYKLPITNYEFNNFEEEEMALLREFYKFEEKIIEASERFSPAVVAEYLLGLARKYNEFYGKYRVIGEKNEEQRLFLTQSTAKILKLGLGLLGIEVLEKM